MKPYICRDHDDPKRWASISDLHIMGADWARLAIRCQTQPCPVGNIEHDNACAQEFLRCMGYPPSWYSKEHYGVICPKKSYRAWTEQDSKGVKRTL